MKKISFFVLLILPLCNLFAQEEKISWRGWDNCYCLKNRQCEVVINASTGGKVIWFALKGENVIYENPQQDGKLMKDWQQEHFDPDGGRFDYGPEKMTQLLHTLTWLGEWKADITGNTLKITSAPDSLLGLKTIREFTLHADSSILYIKLSATNITHQSIVRHFWSRTLLKPGGIMHMPINKSGRLAKGWGKFIKNPNGIDTLPANDERVVVDPPVLTFIAVGPTLKGGTDAMNGWMSYQVNNLKFKKSFPVNPGGDYSASNHMTTIFYCNGKFIELEPCSPTYFMAPCQTITFSEKWELKETHE